MSQLKHRYLYPISSYTNKKIKLNITIHFPTLLYLSLLLMDNKKFVYQVTHFLWIRISSTPVELFTFHIHSHTRKANLDIFVYISQSYTDVQNVRQDNVVFFSHLVSILDRRGGSLVTIRSRGANTQRRLHICSFLLFCQCFIA